MRDPCAMTVLWGKRRGSSCLATLGWRTQSLRDCRKRAERRRFGKIAEAKRGAAEARWRGEERDQKAEGIIQNAAFLLGHLAVRQAQCGVRNSE